MLPVKVKNGWLKNVKELARINVGKRTETMQYRDITKAVMEIIREPMVLNKDGRILSHEKSSSSEGRMGNIQRWDSFPCKPPPS